MSTRVREVTVAGSSTATVQSAIAMPSRQGVDRFVDFLNSAWRPAAVIVGLFLAWWLVTTAGWVAAYLIPTPADVWHTMVQSAGFLWANTLVTLYETVAGFVIAAVAGIAIAMWIVYSPNAEKSLYPLLVFAQVIPKVAIAPLFIIWLGFGSAPKVLVAVLVAFFPVVVSTIAGLRSVDPDLLDLASTMGSSQWKTFRKIRFPASLPHVFSGLKVAATLAVIGAVVGEFVGANEGIGYVLLNANGNLNTPMLYAGLIILSAIGIVVFMVIEVAERVLIPWQPSRRVNAAAAVA